MPAKTPDLCYSLEVPSARPLMRIYGSNNYAIRASKTVKIQAWSWMVAETGLILLIPKGHKGILVLEKTLTSKSGITAHAGIIDSNNRNPIKVYVKS